MSKPASSEFSCGAVVVEIATAATDAEGFVPPEWIKISPKGAVDTRDGRKFSFPVEELVARFSADKVDIPIDLDHATAGFSQAGAIGWVKALEAREDGLYGRVDWLDEGVAALKSRSRRYISPSFRHTKAGKAVWLHSVALVAAPALSMPALAHASPETDEVTNPEELPMNAIAEALGLKADASEAACLSAITSLTADKVDKAVHDEALANLKAASDELAALKSAAREETVDTLLESALSAKKITPAQRDSYAALCATDEGLEQVKALLEVTQAGLAVSDLDNKKAAESDDDVDASSLSARASAYQAEQAGKGITIDIATAVNHVKGESA